MLSPLTLKRLDARMEELALLFLDQCDVEQLRDLSTNEARGNSVWLKKNHNQTIALVVRLQSLINLSKGIGVTTPGGADPAENAALIAQAERDAQTMINRVRQARV